MTTLPISVCIIAKNEEQHIEECLKRLKPYHCEIVFVDTGSTDRTVEIAAKYTDRIYHFDWIDDFSAARNYALSQAGNDWILSIDCDEYLESIDADALLLLIEQHSYDVGQVLIRNRFTQGGQSSVENVRVSRFFNRNYYHFEGAIHEQVERKHSASNSEHISKVINPPKKSFTAPITLLHVGYDGSEAEMREKSLRNIALLEKELESTGADAYLYYQLGQSCMRLNDYEKAYEWFNLGLSMDVDPAQGYVQNMVESYGYCLLDLKRYAEALQLTGIYDIFAIRADFVFLMGLIYMNNAKFNEAIEEFKKATTMTQYSVEGVNSHRANYNIGVIYECLGYTGKAYEYYTKCDAFEPARKRLLHLDTTEQK
ncbi:MAG: glycosyltransferase [Lachnospiraceae bacterium]|nr:glycosyltransferase [Lachnospiraceae bacterium]